METLKKKLPLIAILAAVLAAVLLLLVIVLPAVHVPRNESFASDQGLRRGYEIIFYGFGPQIRLSAHEFDPNPMLIAAVILPILGALIMAPMWKNAKAAKRKVICGLLGVFDLYAGICFLNVCSIAYTTAVPSIRSSDAIAMWDAIKQAPDQFYALPLTTVTAVVCIAAAACLAAGLFLTKKES